MGASFGSSLTLILAFTAEIHSTKKRGQTDGFSTLYSRLWKKHGVDALMVIEVLNVVTKECKI